MFNPERLLGQLLGDAMSGQLGGKRRKGRHGGSSGLGSLLGGGSVSTGTKAAVGLGLLGVAFAAYDHFSKQQGGGATPTPLASAGVGAGATMPPPPPPPGSAMPSPPPANASRGENAMLLLRAMITAAHADGLIDADERGAIVGRARDAGLDAETLQALDAEIRAPLTLEQLAVRTPPGLRDQVYAAALIAITADTDDERRFLDRLAGELSLSDDARRGIHQQLGLA